MLKFFYRLKRRGGVVLFAVIAMMTLLIAMASTAYFTARSSYKTVVSNYNFSQMYLAATSVSDMMIAAATQDALYTTETGATPGKNFFKTLKNEIKNLKSKTPGTAEAQFTAVSYNDDATVNISATDTEEQVFNKIKTEGFIPVEEGIVDALKVVVALEKIGWENDKDEHGNSAPFTGDHNTASSDVTSRFYFSFTTTAYYHENSITVQDIINNEARKDDPDPSDPPNMLMSTGQEEGGDGKTDRAAVIDSDKVSDRTYFQNKTTIFCGNTRSNEFYGGVTATGGLYLCGMARAKCEFASEERRDDWFIGGDFALLEKASIYLDLKDNNLYVAGDLIVAEQNAITAKDIFVQGNIYVINGQFPLNLSGSLYVGGNIYAGSPRDLTLSNTWTGRPLEYGTTVKSLIEGLQSKIDDAALRSGQPYSYYNNAVKPGDTKSSEGWSYTGKVYQTPGKTITGFSSTNYSELLIYDPTSEEREIHKSVINGHTYDHSSMRISIAKLFSKKSGSPLKEHNYNNYTCDQTVYENVIGLDFSNYNADQNNEGTWEWEDVGKTKGFVKFQAYATDSVGNHYDSSGEEITKEVTAKYNRTDNIVTFEFKSAKGDIVTVEQTGGANGPITFKFPQSSSGGYRLYLKGKKYEWGYGFPYSVSGQKTFIFETKPDEYKSDGETVLVDNTMHVVLMANFNDGSGKTLDENNNNAFSWKGGNYDSQGSEDWILAAGEGFPEAEDGTVTVKGKLMLEAGNIVTRKEGAPTSYPAIAYKPFRSDTAHYNDADCVTYYTAQKEAVCTVDQKNKMKKTSAEPWKSDPAVISMLKTGTTINDIDPLYENRIMLISCQMADTAFNSVRLDNLFCGYIWAPYGSAHIKSDGSKPIFGGLVVSDYSNTQAYLYYAEPDPVIIKELLDSVEEVDDEDEDVVPTEGIWHVSGDVYMGRNYLG